MLMAALNDERWPLQWDDDVIRIRHWMPPLPAHPNLWLPPRRAHHTKATSVDAGERRTRKISMHLVSFLLSDAYVVVYWTADNAE